MAMEQSYTPLTCVQLTTKKFSFVSLLDGGANVSVVALGLVKALNLLDKVHWSNITASSWNDTECNFKGSINLTFKIANKRFCHKFLVAQKLVTGTPAILGKDFLQKSEATLAYTKDSVSVTLKRGKQVIPLEKASEKVVTLNAVKASGIKEKFLKRTFGEKREAKKVTSIKSCEAVKVEPIMGSVIRAVLPPLTGMDWPKLAHVDYSEPRPGLVVESQLLTVKKHQPNPRSKHSRHCQKDSCVGFCPTKKHAYTHMYVFNSSVDTAYVTVECKLGSVEPIWEQKSSEERKRGKEDKSKKVTPRAPRSEKSEEPQEEHYEDGGDDHSEPPQINYLNLDPVQDKREYERQYQERHDPRIPIRERRERVQEMLSVQPYEDIHPMAKQALLRYSEVVHIDGLPFVGVKSIEHKILYNGPVFHQRQYKTPQALEEDVLAEVDRLLKEDFIETSDSGYNNPYLPIVKFDPQTQKTN